MSHVGHSLWSSSRPRPSVQRLTEIGIFRCGGTPTSRPSEPIASVRRPDDKITPMARKKRKDPAAVSLGRRGGKAAAGRAQAARWAGTTAAERKKIMRKVIEARWGKKRKTT